MNQGYYNNGNNYNNGYNNNYNGYNQYNNVNYNNRFIPNYNPNNKNNKDDNTSLLPLIIVIGILLVVVILLIVLLLFPTKSTNTTNTSETDNTEKEKENTKIDTSDITIGNSNFGYMKIPYDYIKDSSSSANLLEYISKDKKYTIKMMYLEDDGRGAYNISKAYAEQIKNDGVTNITQAQITIDGKEAYQIYGVTEEDRTVLTICLQAGGYIRFVAIEGPDGTNIVFKSLESYTL